MFLFSSVRGGSESPKRFAVFISYTLTNIPLAADVTTNGVHYFLEWKCGGTGVSFCWWVQSRQAEQQCTLRLKHHKMLPYDSCPTEAFHVFSHLKKWLPFASLVLDITATWFNSKGVSWSQKLHPALPLTAASFLDELSLWLYNTVWLLICDRSLTNLNA